MPTLSVAVEEAFALTSRVLVVRLREGCGPGPWRSQDVRLDAPGREPVSATVTGLEFLDGPGDGLGVALVICGAAASDVPPGTLVTFEWNGRVRDEASTHGVLRQVLEDEGYRVTTAPDGAALCVAAEGAQGARRSTGARDKTPPTDRPGDRAASSGPRRGRRAR